MQYLGTDWIRKTYGAGAFVDIVKGTIAEQTDRLGRGNAPDRLLFIISDCRFKNEFEEFPEALRVRLECPQDVRMARAENWRDNDTHPSEVDLDTYSAMDMFDMYFPTDKVDVAHMANLVIAQLAKNNWVEKREMGGHF